MGKWIRYRWKRLLALAAVLGCVVWLIVLRTSRHEAVKGAPVDPETTPTMITLEASSLVTDSGYTRYLIEAPTWYVFDEAQDPHWRFDNGLYLEKYDDSMRVVATFDCDTAIYRSAPKIWQFIGNVRMNNEAGDKFDTQLMFWDQNTHKIYSDSFVHIEKQDRIIEGYGFESDERIQTYSVNRPSMILPVSDFGREAEADSGSSGDSGTTPGDSDSSAAAPASPGAPATAASPGQQLPPSAMSVPTSSHRPKRVPGNMVPAR